MPPRARTPGSSRALDARLLASALERIAPDLAWPAAARALASGFEPHQLARGAPLLGQGETWSRAYLVEEGLVRLHFLERSGREHNKNFYAEGSLILPIAPAMWEQASLFGITGIERARVWSSEAAPLRAELGRRGLWEPLQRELLSQLLTSKLQREHDLLALGGRERYDAFCARSPALAVRVPLKHLATYLGMTDVSLSRVRRMKLREEERSLNIG